MCVHKILTYNFLLQSKDVVIEEFMKFLIRIVDAKLLERVRSEIFKPEDIQ